MINWTNCRLIEKLAYKKLLHLILYSVPSFCFHHFYFTFQSSFIPLCPNYIHPLRWKKSKLSVWKRLLYHLRFQNTTKKESKWGLLHCKLLKAPIMIKLKNCARYFERLSNAERMKTFPIIPARNLFSLIKFPPEWKIIISQWKYFFYVFFHQFQLYFFTGMCYFH